MRAGERGHSRELGDVLDEVVDLAVRELTGCIGLKIGDAWVDIGADGGPPMPIYPVTGGALGHVDISALFDGERVVSIRIHLAAVCTWNGEVADLPGHDRLESRGGGRGSKAAPLEETSSECYEGEHG